MALKRLNAKCIADLDEGAAGVIIDRAINEAMADLDDRGQEDELPRKVIIEIEAITKEGRLMIGAKAFTKLPPRHTRTTLGVVAKSGDSPVGAHFRSDNSSNPEQPTLEFDKNAEESK